MDRRRGARALGILLLGVLAGTTTCAVAPPSGGSLAEHLAMDSLGLEIFLAGVALAGASLSPAPLRRRLGLGPLRPPAHRLVLLVVGTIALSHGLDGVIQLLQLREQSALATFDFTLAGASGGALALALVGIGLAPAIAEELLCRGLVQRGLLERFRPVVAIPLASAFFGALHVDPVLAVSTSVLGLYLGLAAFLAGSVWAAITCHAANNLLAVAAAARLPELELAHPALTTAGFVLAALCLWAAERDAAAATLDGSRGSGMDTPSSAAP